MNPPTTQESLTSSLKSVVTSSHNVSLMLKSGKIKGMTEDLDVDPSSTPCLPLQMIRKKPGRKDLKRLREMIMGLEDLHLDLGPSHLNILIMEGDNPSEEKEMVVVWVVVLEAKPQVEEILELGEISEARLQVEEDSEGDPISDVTCVTMRVMHLDDARLTQEKYQVKKSVKNAKGGTALLANPKETTQKEQEKIQLKGKHKY